MQCCYCGNLNAFVWKIEGPSSTCEDTSCFDCAHLVAETARHCFQQPYFSELEELSKEKKIYSESLLDFLPLDDPGDIQKIALSVFPSRRKCIRFEEFSPSQYENLLLLPDRSDTDVYQHLVSLVFQSKIQINPWVWMYAILRALPVPADWDSDRVVENELGERVSEFHGNEKILQVLLQAIGILGVQLSSTCWMEAFLRAGPHCTRCKAAAAHSFHLLEHSSGNFTMIRLLLEAMRKQQVVLPVNEFIRILWTFEKEIHNEILTTFLEIIFQDPHSKFLEELVLDSPFDPHLMVFVEVLYWLIKSKDIPLLQAIFCSFFKRMSPLDFDKCTQVICVMRTCHVPASLLYEISLQSPLLKQVLAQPRFRN